MDWFKIGKGVHQGCTASSCLFSFYAEYVIQNARLDESQAGIKIARRNIKNLRYTGDTPLNKGRKRRGTRESLDEGEKRSEKSGIKLNIQKTKIMASGPSTSWQRDRETVTGFIYLLSEITADGDCSHEIKNPCSLEEKLWQTQTVD